jgi:hypothetical protein
VRLIKTDPGDKVTSASLVEAAAEEETEESPRLKIVLTQSAKRKDGI